MKKFIFFRFTLQFFFCLTATLTYHSTARCNDLEIIVFDTDYNRLDLLLGDSLYKTPVSYKSYSNKKISEKNIDRISTLSHLDPSVSESYSAAGYYDLISIRGIQLDPKNNILRNGLPILAETSLFLDNKSEIQIIKGTYGLMSGFASPGGLVNLISLKPLSESKTEVEVKTSNENNWGVNLKNNNDFTEEWPLKTVFFATHENLNSVTQNMAGEKNIINGIAAYKMNESTTLQFEIEYSKKSQPSKPGFSLLGNLIPSVPSNQINLNNQPWSLPVEFSSFIYEFNIKYAMAKNKNIDITFLSQNLLTNDRVAFPFGCTAEGNYDRFCSDGTFDLYDFRSENEKRTNNVGQIKYSTDYELSDVKNKTTLSYMYRLTKEDDQKQAYNYVGVGNIYGTSLTPQDSSLNDQNTNRETVSNQISLAQSVEYKSLFINVGTRGLSQNKKTIRTDSSRPTDNNQLLLTSFISLGYKTDTSMLYTSYSEGFESYVTPNKTSYSLPGTDVKNAISRQVEVGYKLDASIPVQFALFQIQRPHLEDRPPFYGLDGVEVFTGLEFEVTHKNNDNEINLTSLFLNPEIKNSTQNLTINNKKPVNLALQTHRLSAKHNLTLATGLSVGADIQYTGSKYITEDNSLQIEPSTTLDLSAQYLFKNNNFNLIVENIFDKKYWKETPTQFGHIYLFAGNERRVSLKYLLKF